MFHKSFLFIKTIGLGFLPFLPLNAMIIPTEKEPCEIENHPLPPEMWAQVIDYLPPKDRASFSLVSLGSRHYIRNRGLSVGFKELEKFNQFLGYALQQKKEENSFFSTNYSILWPFPSRNRIGSVTSQVKSAIIGFELHKPLNSLELRVQDLLKVFLENMKALESLHLKVSVDRDGNKFYNYQGNTYGLISDEEKEKIERTGKNRMIPEILPPLSNLSLRELHMTGRGATRSFIKAFIEEETKKEEEKRTLENVSFSFLHYRALIKKPKEYFFKGEDSVKPFEKLNQWRKLQSFTLRNYVLMDFEKISKKLTNFDCHAEVPSHYGKDRYLHHGTFTFRKK